MAINLEYPRNKRLEIIIIIPTEASKSPEIARQNR